MSLTMVSIVIVLSSVGSISSYAMLSDAAEPGLNPLHSGIDPGPTCDEPAEDVPPPGFRSVLRSVRRLVVQPELRRLPTPAVEPLTSWASPLPAAPPLPLPAPSPAPIGPSTRLLARTAPRPAAVLMPHSDNTETERRLDLPPIIQIQTSHPAQISVGRTMRLTLAVRNAGASAAEALRIRTTLPEQAVFVASHPEPSAAEQGVLHFELGALPAGAVRQIDLELLPRAAGPVEVQTVADFSVASCTLIHIGRPQLSLTCQAPQAADLGDHVRYRLVIRNTGDGLAEQVVVEPQVLGAGKGPHSRRRRFSIGDLAPGASREITLSDAARRADALLVRFFASDRNGSEAETEVCVQVRRPTVEITLTGPDDIALGDEGLFEIRAANTGIAAVEPVRVACAVGDGLRLTVVDQQVQFATKAGQLTWAIGRLAGGETKTLRFQARPVTAGEQQIRVAVENVGAETPRYPRPAAEKIISIRDRTVDQRTACR